MKNFQKRAIYTRALRFARTEAAQSLHCAAMPAPCAAGESQNHHQTFMAGKYAKTTARGHGQHQCFVITPVVYNNFFILATH